MTDSVFFFVDLEWKMIYVGCAESEEFDQILDTIYVGPIPEGRHMFVFQVKNKSLLFDIKLYISFKIKKLQYSSFHLLVTF